MAIVFKKAGAVVEAAVIAPPKPVQLIAQVANDSPPWESGAETALQALNKKAAGDKHTLMLVHRYRKLMYRVMKAQPSKNGVAVVVRNEETGVSVPSTFSAREDKLYDPVWR